MISFFISNLQLKCLESLRVIIVCAYELTNETLFAFVSHLQYKVCTRRDENNVVFTGTNAKNENE